MKHSPSILCSLVFIPTMFRSVCCQINESEFCKHTIVYWPFISCIYVCVRVCKYNHTCVLRYILCMFCIIWVPNVHYRHFYRYVVQGTRSGKSDDHTLIRSTALRRSAATNQPRYEKQKKTQWNEININNSRVTECRKRNEINTSNRWVDWSSYELEYVRTHDACRKWFV